MSEPGNDGQANTDPDLGRGYLSAFMKPYCVAVMAQDSREKYYVATGTLVTVENRYFVATAGHFIREHSSDRVWIVPSSGVVSAASAPRIVSQWHTPGDSSDNLDLASLELSPHDAIHMRGLSFFDVSYFPTNIKAAHGNFVLLMGFPAELVDTKYHKEGGIFPCGAPYFGRSRPIDKLPKDVPADLNIVLDYPASGLIDYETGRPVSPPDAEGYSGGPVVIAKPPNSEMSWTSSTLKLIAFQQSWRGGQGWLRATHAIHWLLAMRIWCPELAPALSDYIRLTPNPV